MTGIKVSFHDAENVLNIAYADDFTVMQINISELYTFKRVHCEEYELDLNKLAVSTKSRLCLQLPCGVALGLK